MADSNNSLYPARATWRVLERNPQKNGNYKEAAQSIENN
jgi:hypothetical protein